MIKQSKSIRGVLKGIKKKEIGQQKKNKRKEGLGRIWTHGTYTLLLSF